MGYQSGHGGNVLQLGDWYILDRWKRPEQDVNVVAVGQLVRMFECRTAFPLAYAASECVFANRAKSQPQPVAITARTLIASAWGGGWK